ncbi:hypothetical protein [Streptomyces ficellus]|uniref:Uncharacterized protein n=1 Tax=Streptomyces ficellus TaxID=1977088 RepID=A0A6I6F901_9ACTN|nr:hypothetical protein [Streptomyces ficellus]QGV80433.1 hypothetical protein EIZ62_21000 [Streptomyces ficellus]
MVRHPLTSPRTRPLRWLLIGLLCSFAGALLVTGVTLLLPDGAPAPLSDLGRTGVVLAVTGALCAVVYLRARRGRQRPPR